MAQQVRPNVDYFGSPNRVNGFEHSREKDDIPSQSGGKTSSAPAYPYSYDNQTGEVYDPYGGKKLGMVRTALIFFTNQVGIGILSLPAMLHTIGLIPGVITSKSHT
ncbi:hypothetical protein M3J09_012560 [Ascochyta lentis]